MHNILKPKILFFSEAVTLAHIARPLALAQSLDPRSYDIYFACDKPYRSLLKDTGYKILPISSVHPDDFLRSLQTGKWLYDAKRLGKYVLEELQIFKEIQPDIVVGDLRYSLAVSAVSSRIPYYNITNAYWSPYATLKRWPVPCYDFVKMLGVPISSLLFKGMKPALFMLINAQINKVRRKYQLEPFPDFATAFTYGDQVLYADIPELSETAPLPEHHRYIGPIEWSPPQQPHQSDLFSWGNSLPFVYLTLGSSGDVSMIQLITDTLLEFPVNVLIATAGRFTLSGLPERIRQVDFAPGKEAAARSQFVICNGGSPTVYQALSVSKPVLGIPSNLDQFLSMENVIQKDAGISLRADTLSPHGLRQAIRSLLDEKRFAERATSLSQKMAHWNAQRIFKNTINSHFQLDNPLQSSTKYVNR